MKSQTRGSQAKRTEPTPDPKQGEEKRRETIRRARAMRKEPTRAEQLLWYYLRGRRLGGAKFRRQHPIGRYILDYYCEEAGLAIEVDGGQHNQPRQQAHDLRRAHELKRRGITVLRFWNNEVLGETERVFSAIWEALYGRDGLLGPERRPRGDENDQKRP